MDIDKKELQAICNAQIDQIFELKSEIEKQKQEILHLKDLLYNATPVISPTSTIADEEFIALNELKKLKYKSQQEDLTYEDAKRVELYFKVINTIKNPKQKEDELKPKKYSTEELLSQVDLNKIT